MRRQASLLGCGKGGSLWDGEKVTPSESGKGGPGQLDRATIERGLNSGARVSLGDRLRQRDAVGVTSTLSTERATRDMRSSSYRDHREPRQEYHAPG